MHDEEEEEEEDDFGPFCKRLERFGRRVTDVCAWPRSHHRSQLLRDRSVRARACAEREFK